VWWHQRASYDFWGEVLKSKFFSFRSNYSYEKALALQGVLSSEDYTGLLAFEAPETITLGRASEQEGDVLVSPSFLRERNIQILSTDRGGGAAYHGPGQLVGFPIINLNRLYGDARAVKRFTEELLLGLAHACAVLGVKSVSTRHDFPRPLDEPRFTGFRGYHREGWVHLPRFLAQCKPNMRAWLQPG
jgi:lipoate-protein ligase B